MREFVIFFPTWMKTTARKQEPNNWKSNVWIQFCWKLFVIFREINQFHHVRKSPLMNFHFSTLFTIELFLQTITINRNDNVTFRAHCYRIRSCMWHWNEEKITATRPTAPTEIHSHSRTTKAENWNNIFVYETKAACFSPSKRTPA